MTTIVIAMVLIVLVAGIFIAYVAFPHRGEDLPGAPWLGRLMRRGAEALPTVEDEPTVPAVPDRASGRYRPSRPRPSYRPNPSSPSSPPADPAEPAAPADRPTGPGRHRGEPTA